MGAHWRRGVERGMVKNVLPICAMIAALGVGATFERLLNYWRLRAALDARDGLGGRPAGAL
jgi:hypothetical protein